MEDAGASNSAAAGSHSTQQTAQRAPAPQLQRSAEDTAAATTQTAKEETGAPVLSTGAVTIREEHTPFPQVAAVPPQPTLAGHLLAVAGDHDPAFISIQPAGAREFTAAHIVGQAVGQTQSQEDRLTPLIVGDQRLPSTYPPNPTPLDNRVPLPYEPQGYMHVFPRADQAWRKALYAPGATDGIHDEVSAMDASAPGSVPAGHYMLAESYEARGGAQRGALHPGEIKIAEQAQAPPAGDFISDEAFEKIVGGFKGGDGKFLAMTAYGAVPLPDEMLHTIPDKFVTKPLIQEREVFVLKQDHRTRVTERDFTQFEHRFVDVPQSLVVEKLKAVEDVEVIYCPHFRYKPVVEEKIIEIPKGIKYVEVPIEVPCRMPPRIIPVPKPHIVERVIETTKPVVQEKIIEVPEIVRKKVPKIVTKDIPYVVPRYVEKIVEVPYQPGQQLPEPQGAQMTVVPKPPPLPGMVTEGGEEQGPHGRPGVTEMRVPRGLPEHGLPERTGFEPAAQRQIPGAEVRGDTLYVEGGTPGVPPPQAPQTFYVSHGIKHIKLPYEARIDVSVIQEEEVPEGVPIAQRNVRYMAPGSRAMAYGEPRPVLKPTGQSTAQGGRRSPEEFEPLYAGPMDPIIEHAAPGMRAVEFRTRPGEPDILTQQGVLKYSKFECCLNQNTDKLLPNLPKHDLVPMDPPGTPNLKDLSYMHAEYAARPGWAQQPLPQMPHAQTTMINATQTFSRQQV